MSGLDRKALIAEAEALLANHDATDKERCRFAGKLFWSELVRMAMVDGAEEMGGRELMERFGEMEPDLLGAWNGVLRAYLGDGDDNPNLIILDPDE